MLDWVFKFNLFESVRFYFFMHKGICKVSASLIVEANMAIWVPTASLDVLSVEIVVEREGVDTLFFEAAALNFMGEFISENFVAIKREDPVI